MDSLIVRALVGFQWFVLTLLSAGNRGKYRVLRILYRDLIFHWCVKTVFINGACIFGILCVSNCTLANQGCVQLAKFADSSCLEHAIGLLMWGRGHYWPSRLV